MQRTSIDFFMLCGKTREKESGDKSPHSKFAFPQHRHRVALTKRKGADGAFSLCSFATLLLYFPTMKKKKSKRELTRQRKSAAAPAKRLVSDLRRLIDQSREQVAVTVNSVLVMMYWHIGRRIREDVLENDRAEYGKEIVQTLSAQLTAEYGRGFGRRNLFQMVRFAEFFADEQIVATAPQQLSWSHFVELIPLEDVEQRCQVICDQ